MANSRIDEFIEKIKDRSHDKQGANSKCYVVNDDYVLLKSRFNLKDIEKVKQTERQLQKAGVAVVPIVAYKTVKEPNEFGYSDGYVLQQRATGEELYSSKISKEEYENRLTQLATRPSDFYEKFAKDWLKINESGLRIDPSKSSNFFYTPEKINFIDLNLGKPSDKETAHLEAMVVLLGGGLNFKYEDGKKEKAEILRKMSLAFIKEGADKDKVLHQAYKQYPEIANIAFPPQINPIVYNKKSGDLSL